MANIYSNKEKKEIKSILHRKKRISHFTFIIFIIISAIFWLLIKLSQEYSQTYNMNVTYSDIPMNKLLTQRIDSAVRFSITARGFYLAELSLLQPDELTIHLKNYTIQKADENIYYISTLPLKEKIAKILGIDPALISFSKNVLSFKLEKLYSKKVDVVGDISLSYEGSYNLYKPLSIIPKKVIIYGSQTALDTISSIKTKHLGLTNIKEDRHLSVELYNPNPNIFRIEPNKVDIDIQVEKFTQSSIEIPISTAASGKSYIETFPKRVKLYYSVALKDFEKVKANQFLVAPSLSNIDIKTAHKLHLEIKKSPSFVRNLRLEPADVEFILVK